MPKHSYGASHMNQGYRSDAGKPKGSYGKPRAGYIDQSGMPNASKSKAYSYMSDYYGKGGMGTSSTNLGTSPSEGSMD